MANPQLENGFTEIANELLEAIYRTSMSDYEHRLFWLIVRKTYGFRKKSDWISNRQAAGETGILKQHVSRTIKRLLERNMILKEGKMLSIQKNYELWKLPIWVTNKSNQNRLHKLPKEVTEVTHTGNKSNLYRDTQNNKLIQNKILQKKSPNTNFSDDSIEIKLSYHLFEKIREKDPNYKKPDIQKWAKDIDLLINIDKRKPEEIMQVIDWCQGDSFWHANILSTAKLREKYTQLYLNMNKEKGEKIGKHKKHFANERDYSDEELKRIEGKFFKT